MQLMAEKNQLIVVAEDDPIIAWQIKLQLDLWSNIEKKYFDDESEAAAYLRNHSPDLIITNLRLIHGWIGIELWQAINSCHCQVLVMTGLRDERLHSNISSLFSPNFLFKPFNALQFREWIIKLLL